MVPLPYTQYGVSIDKALARGNGETIQVAAITSIQTNVSYSMWWMPGVAAGVGAFGALLGGRFAILVVLAVVAAICFWMAGRFKSYDVIVRTASGDNKVFARTPDAAAAQKIRYALETAISERG